MQAKLGTMFTAGLFVVGCTAVILLLAGCQSSNQFAASNASSGPASLTETQTTYKPVPTIDPETLEKIEGVFGYLPEFRAAP